MARLLVPGATPTDGCLALDGAALRHLRVLRLGPGDECTVLDGAGAEHRVRLEQVDTRSAVARVLGTARPARESPLDLVLAPALVKGDRMALVVEKATELGVRRIAPVHTARTVRDRIDAARLRRVARAAAEQSGRPHVPVVDEPQPLAAVLATPWAGLRLLPWEDEHGVRLRDLPAAAAAIVAVTGPEGGFTADEVALARTYGFTTMTLGPRILRAETAAITAAALLQARYGDG
ncbi:MAG: 16S rRNA (uracil(1498)-N(3))-methyltransferase [bacterium]|nr:16S rRNA (uracil(1498)-N(3))-methyltransferase [bacterium]